MFCHKCGERIWEGKSSCQKCGTDVPDAARTADGPGVSRLPAPAAALGLLAALAAGFAIGAWAYGPFRARPSGPEAVQHDKITPMDARDPSALVMGPARENLCPCPEKKSK